MDDANKPQTNFIAGQRVTSKKVLDNIDPATGAVSDQHRALTRKPAEIIAVWAVFQHRVPTPYGELSN